MLLLAAETARDSGLLSTVAGNAATLVGIVGGFTVSRVVALAAERTGVQRQLHETRTDREAAEKLLEEHDAENLRAELDRAVWAVRESLLTMSGQVGGDALLSHIEHQDYGATVRQLVDRFDEASAAVRRCLTWLYAQDDDDTWREWREARGHLEQLAPEERTELLKRVYDTAEDRREQRLEAEERERELERRAERERAAATNPLGRMFAGVNIPAFGPVSRYQPLDFDDFVGADLPRVATVPEQSRAALERRVNELRLDERRFVVMLISVRTPPDLFGGLAVLGLFALVSIALPLGMAGFAPEMRMTTAWRNLVTGLFLAGLLSLLTYVALTLRTATGRAFWPWQDPRRGRRRRAQEGATPRS